MAKVSLRAGCVERLGAGRHYLESSITGLAGTIRFEWDALGEWCQEDVPNRHGSPSCAGSPG